MIARAISGRSLLALVLAAAAAGVGCGPAVGQGDSSSSAKAAESSDKGSKRDKQDDEDRPRRKSYERSEDDVSEKGKSWGGWRWKGKRDDCYYVVDNKCFAERKDACKAACGKHKRRCRYSDSAPSKVSCRK
jgi:hypothetical protein